MKPSKLSLQRLVPDALKTRSPRTTPDNTFSFPAKSATPPGANDGILERLVKRRPGASTHAKVGREPMFVGDVEAIARDAAPQAGAVITGGLVFASLSAEPPNDNYVKQPARPLSPWHNFKSQRFLHVWVHKTLVAKAKSRKYRFAVDAVLRLGRQTKGKSIIFTGFNTTEHTYLNYYTFHGGELVKVEEKLLPLNPDRYETELRMIVSDLHSFSDINLYWTAPLPPITYPGLKTVPSSVFTKLRSSSVNNAGRKTFDPQRLAPIAACVIATVAYGAAIGSQFVEYHRARHNAEDESKALTAATDSLDVLVARQAWLRSPNAMAAHTDAIQPLLMAIALHNQWRINSITVRAPRKDQTPAQMKATAQQVDAADGDASDVSLQLTIPSTGAAPLDQAQPVLDTLAGATGFNLHLAANGWQVANTGTGEHIALHIEGVLQDGHTAIANDRGRTNVGAVTGVKP